MPWKRTKSQEPLAMAAEVQGIHCPSCKSIQSKVKDVRPVELGGVVCRRRWRKCLDCAKIYTTIEVREDQSLVALLRIEVQTAQQETRKVKDSINEFRHAWNRFMREVPFK